MKLRNFIVISMIYTGISYGAEVKISTKVTYYWTVFPENESKKLVEVKDPKGKVIDRAPASLMKRIAIEGSGFLPPTSKHPNGVLINLYKQGSYIKVDAKKAPWGLDARGNALVPFKSVAVDKNEIPLGSKLFIPQLKGMKLSDGSIHNGCLVATDTGYGVKGKHIDIFTGTRSEYVEVDKKLKHQSQLDLIIDAKNCKS